MSQHDSSKPTTIKIAAKDASQRHSAGGADPGPGDPSAAPSVAPQVVDIPNPPTPSELVVKSTNSKHIVTLNASEGRGGSSRGGIPPYKSTMASQMSGAATGGGSRHHSSSKHSEHSVQGSQVGPAASNPSVGAPREPTSSKTLTGPPKGSTVGGSAGAPKSISGAMSGAVAGPTSAGHPVSGASSHSPSQGAGSRSTSPAATASTAMQADSGVVHDEDEEGEGELEHPPGETPPSSASPGPAVGGLRGSSMASGGVSQQQSVGGSGKSSSDADTPASSGTGFSKLTSSDKSSPSDKKKKKVTKFRYHKRITVRTTGKTSPGPIMDKVHKKDHQAGITPSTIEDLDPQELMKRAGIKAGNQTHWRVRMRQTKRLTKDGKTITQTKVAYRDSEGNKRVKSSSSPFCKSCGKKLEDCKCDSNSQSGA